MNSQVFFEVKNVSKSFGPTKALKEVNLKLYRSEIRGLIGENGSGKSTLSSIIVGTQKPDQGMMEKEGMEYVPRSVHDASKYNISMIVQDMCTISQMTVAENIFLGKEERFQTGGFLNIRKMNEEAQKLLDSINASHISAGELIDNYVLEDRKVVEMARAMINTPEILIVDETTTALPQRGRDFLYDLMRRLRDECRTILFISHDLEEVRRMCDNVTIMRDGIIIDTIAGEDINLDKMRQLMIGRKGSNHYYRQDNEPDFDKNCIVLQVRNISTDLLKGISLDLHFGEILGIGGLADCGMHDIGRIIFGITKPKMGTVKLADGTLIQTPEQAVRKKVSYLSKNRDQEALMLTSSIKDNICLPSLDMLKKGIAIPKKKEKEMVDRHIDLLSIKADSSKQWCNQLSGGNKQKVVIAKWLANESEIFLMDCPTRGIDIGVKAAVYDLMQDLKKRGKAILMISEELPELIGMSDRLLIIRDGKIQVEMLRGNNVTEENIIQYMI